MKQLFTKIIVIAILPLFISGRAVAQQFLVQQHEFSVYSGGGLSTLNYKTTVGGQKSGFGGQFGLGYRYFITPELSFGTGLEFAFFNAKYDSKSVKTSYMTTDRDGDKFEFRSVADGFKEKQRSMLLQIPVMAQYQFGNIYYAGGGFKVGIPLSKKFSNKASKLENSGFYDEENYLYTIQEFIGFGTFNNVSSKGELDLKTAFFLSLEGGAKWILNDKFTLYSGIYFDYGLNSIIKKRQNTHLIEYNGAKPTEFAMNSVISSQYAQVGSPAQDFTDKVKPIAVGIKLRMTFGKKKWWIEN